ncbi:MAG: hypothetical protein PHQ23_15480, partial [Candidatus Wallbacteria bacterium]|nr:hypothetical protein [Candidatus Wallbacteria bacterium]
SDYNNQLGNALELSGSGRKPLEFFQFLCYAGLYLGNGRVNDFMSFLCDYRSEAMCFLKKFFLGNL